MSPKTIQTLGLTAEHFSNSIPTITSLAENTEAAGYTETARHLRAALFHALGIVKSFEAAAAAAAKEKKDPDDV
jgi:hypothetical protein